MPNTFQNIHRDVYGTLSDLARKFAKTLRWRQSDSGPHSPFRFVGFEWSKDKIHWDAMWSTTRATWQFSEDIYTITNDIIDFEHFRLPGEEEPLGHKLVRKTFDIA